MECLLFTSSREGQYNIFQTLQHSSSEVHRFTASQNPQKATSWSPDGKIVLINEIDSRTGIDILWFSVDARDKPQILIKTPFRELEGKFSPDGRWVSFESNITGKTEVYVQPFPGPGERRQISNHGGETARWNPSGKELFYLEGNKLMCVSFRSEPLLQIGKPESLFEMKVSPYSLDYDISKDGERFLFVEALEEKQASPQLHVVLNWFQDLQDRVSKKD